MLHAKSYAFALRIVRMAKFLRNDQQEFILSKQVLRSGTAIGALVRESEFAQSPADFINKLSVALKEANETDYWLCLLQVVPKMKWNNLKRANITEMKEFLSLPPWMRVQLQEEISLNLHHNLVKLILMQTGLPIRMLLVYFIRLDLLLNL